MSHRLLQSLLTLGVVLASHALVGGAARAHSGTANPASLEVCEDAVLGDTCEFVDHHEFIHRGTCRSNAGTLVCLRHKPLIKRSALARATADVSRSSLASATGLTCAGLLMVGAFARRQTPFHGEHDEDE